MPSKLRPLPSDLSEPVKQWAEALRQLAEDSGEPSLHQLAPKLNCAPASLSRYLGGARLDGAWKVAQQLAKIVAAQGGTPPKTEVLRALWEQARKANKQTDGDDTDANPPGSACRTSGPGPASESEAKESNSQDESRPKPVGLPLRSRIPIMLLSVVLLAGGQVTDVLAAAPMDHRCSEPVQVNLDVSVEMATVVRRVVSDFERELRSDGCTEATVQVTVARSSDGIIAALGRGWSDPTDLGIAGPEPHVWLAASRWEVEAAQRELERTRARVSLDSKGSIARSPLVLAMPKQTAAAWGALQRLRTWSELLETAQQLAVATPNGVSFRRPSPVSSAAGLAATIALYTAKLGRGVDGGVLKPEDLYDIERLFSASDDESTTMLCALRERGTAAGVALLVSEKAAGDFNEGGSLGTACPEQDHRPSEPLMLTAPAEGTPYLDYPFVVVNWTDLPVNVRRQRVIQRLFEYLHGPYSLEELRSKRFRNPDGNVPLFAGALPGRPDDWPVTAVNRTAMLQAFREASKPARVMFVVENSVAMDAPFPDGQGRLHAVASTLGRSLRSIADSDEIGLSTFARHEPGEPDQLDQVPLGRPDDDLGGRSRVTAVTDTLNQLRPGTAQSAPPDAALRAAVTRLRENTAVDAREAVVIIADGTSSGSRDEDLVDFLNQGLPRVPVYLLAFSAKVCTSSPWPEITRAQGACYQIATPAELRTALDGIAAALWGGNHG